MLLQMKRSGIGFIEQPIETVYDPDDYSSHYNAVKDSWKLAKVMLRFLVSGSGFRYVISSVASLLLDYVLYTGLLTVFGTVKEAAFHLLSTFLSSVLNFNLNKFWVFRKQGNYGRELLGYYAICIPRTLLPTVLASTLIASLQAATPALAVIVRLTLLMV